MATASPSPAPRRPASSAARRLAPAVLTSVAVALLVLVVFGPWYLNYDARYALLWATDLVNGFTPEYEADFAPTPHPLQTAASALALPFGAAADDVVLLLVLLSFGALVRLVYSLGAELFSPGAGVVAALVVLTRPALLRDAVLAYQDLPFAALVVGAVLMEARRPRRGAAVVAVLAVAGLLRPEAWVLAGLYVLYVWRGRTNRERAGLVALAAAAPAIWALTDFLVTGDFLHSLHGTAALAEEAGRRRHVSQVPFWTVQYFGYVLREPLLVGIPIGLAFAWRHRRHRAVLPLAVAAAMTAVFAIGPIFGLPLIGRYIRTPAVLLTLFYGLAVVGWRSLPPGRERTLWKAAAAVAVLASVAWLPWHARMVSAIETRIDRHGTLYADLRDLGQAPRVRALFRACAPLSAADHRPIPYLRYWLDGPPGSVGTVESGASPLGRLLLVPNPTREVRRFYRENLPRDVRPPAGYRVAHRNRSWTLYAAPGCRAPSAEASSVAAGADGPLA